VISTLYLVESREAEQFLGEVSDMQIRAMTKALNKTGPHTRTRMDRAIRDQVAFPASYLRPSTKRLFVAKKATRAKLETVIEGRGRPTSLARFIKGGGMAMKNRKRRPEEIQVEVKPGSIQGIKRAWVVSLPGSPDSNNLGLAVRTPAGQKPKGAYAPKRLDNNVWLLYGPSVNQILYSVRNRGGVIEEMYGPTLDYLSDEYSRQLKLEMQKNG
jgi:hypothetical protein